LYNYPCKQLILEHLGCFIMFDFQDEIRRAAEVLKSERDLLSSEEAIELVIQDWVRCSIELQLEDIAWHYVNSSALEKLLKAPELAAERLMLGAGNVAA
jgi:hypothetical protein